MCQSWYTLWSATLALLWLLPAVALIIHQPIASVDVDEFVLYFAPVILASSLMWCETRRWLQPAGVRLSWRAAILEAVRWPVVLWALLNVVFAVRRPYMITPKGADGAHGLGWASVYGPYIALTGLQLAAIWVFRATAGGEGIEGYYGLALFNAAIGALAIGVTVALEVRQLAADGRDLATAVRIRAGALLCAGVLALLLTVSAVAVWEPMTQAIT
jgi:cellulose synthase (UDP-forming)